LKDVGVFVSFFFVLLLFCCGSFFVSFSSNMRQFAVCFVCFFFFLLQMQGFDVARDIETIYKACRGIGTDEKALISVICNRPKDYLLFLRAEYPKHHKVDLIHLCEKELSGNLERVIVAVLSNDAENRARFLHDAVKGAGTDEKALIDVLCTALPSQIHAAKEVWKHRYSGVKFENRVKSEVRILLLLSFLFFVFEDVRRFPGRS
jgi:hypothetical protein